MLSEWMHAGVKFVRSSVAVESLLSIAGFGLAAWLLYSHMGSVMLLVYWAISLPAQGRNVARLARQYPAIRNVVLRLFEPLGAPEEANQCRENDKTEQESQSDVTLRIEQASVLAGSHIILQENNLSIDSAAILIMRYSIIYQIVVIFCLLLTTLFFVEFRRNSHFFEIA